MPEHCTTVNCCPVWQRLTHSKEVDIALHKTFLNGYWVHLMDPDAGLIHSQRYHWEINCRSSHFDCSRRRELFCKKKDDTVFVDLTATYDTSWHHSLTCKLLHQLPEKHMVKMIMEFVT